MLKMFGIENCSTVQKARCFLEKNKITYEFIDMKKTPPSEQLILNWKEACGGWPINKSGLTFRALRATFDNLSDMEKIKLIQAKPSLIRRPLIMRNDHFLFMGFSEKKYQDLKS